LIILWMACEPNHFIHAAWEKKCLSWQSLIWEWQTSWMFFKDWSGTTPAYVHTCHERTRDSCPSWSVFFKLTQMAYLDIIRWHPIVMTG
jgi:hypothetical protein